MSHTTLRSGYTELVDRLIRFLQGAPPSERTTISPSPLISMSLLQGLNFFLIIPNEINHVCGKTEYNAYTDHYINIIPVIRNMLWQKY